MSRWLKTFWTWGSSVSGSIPSVVYHRVPEPLLTCRKKRGEMLRGIASFNLNYMKTTDEMLRDIASFNSHYTKKDRRDA